MELYDFELLNERSQTLLAILTHDIDRVGKSRQIRFKYPFKLITVIELVTEFSDTRRLYQLTYFRNRPHPRRWLVEVLLVRQPDARFAALSSRNKRVQCTPFFKVDNTTVLDKPAQVRLTKFVDILLAALADNLAR